MKLLEKIRIKKRILRRNQPLTFLEEIAIRIILLKAIKKDILVEHLLKDAKTEILYMSQHALKTRSDLLTTDALKMVKSHMCICRYLIYKDEPNFVIAYYILDFESGNYIFEMSRNRWHVNEYIPESSKTYMKAMFELNIGLRNDGINQLLGYYKQNSKI